MKKIISVLTATRAEYGLLHRIIIELKKIPEFDIRVVVTGAHLSHEHGLTYKEIEEDQIEIDEKIEILLSSDSNSAVSKSMGLALIGFSDYFARLKPDLLLVIGDRYETLAVCIAAMNEHIPIGHLYGGDITEGAIDDCIRHSISKLSNIHFTSIEEHSKRLIQMGEDPEQVYQVGAIGIENIIQEERISKYELETFLDLSLDKPFAIVTFHPATLEPGKAKDQFSELLEACKLFPEMKFIFTKANADAEGRGINDEIDRFVAENKNAVGVFSLGSKRYLSALEYADMVIGNSSSGLIEVPSFKIPTVNIGNRQSGRLAGESVINCKPKKEDIAEAIKKAKSKEFLMKIEKTINPYGDGETSLKVGKILKRALLERNVDFKKTFFDIKD